jgi:aryl-alcohol dehydrogenase-like predicted oxidoreductase
LSASQQGEADQVLDLLLEYGINHIDTAPLYGMAEERLGPWMKHHRKEFFLATKIDKRTYRDAKVQFQQSLEKLQVDWVDLLQLHNLTDVVGPRWCPGIPGGGTGQGADPFYRYHGTWYFGASDAPAEPGPLWL